MRTSAYRNKIVSALQKNHLMSLQDIAQEFPEADFSTIYRNVEALVISGEVKHVSLSPKKSLYELSHHVHGHFVCTDCGLVRVFEVPPHMVADCVKVEDVSARGLCISCNK
jgi:Fe2+ or Zn2+ uptake regulation protein